MNAVAHSIYNDALATATKRVGSPAKLATAIGVGLHKVTAWIGGADVNPEFCPAIEQATGVTCDELRPDLLWVRDASSEVLAYAVPVDGADVPYVRQALSVAPQTAPDPLPAAALSTTLATTSIEDDNVRISHEDTGVVRLAVNGCHASLDAMQAALVAEAILDHRASALGWLPVGQFEELADEVHALLPISVKLEGDGLWKRLTGAGLEQSVATYIPTGIERNYYCQLRVGDLSVKLPRAEADALAWALTGGNDGSSLAHVAKLACADMSEAIAVLNHGETEAMKAETVAGNLAKKVNQLLDLHYQYEHHSLRRHGNLRNGYPATQDSCDALAEAAQHAIAAMATVRGSLARGEYVSPSGKDLGEPRDRGFYQGLRNAEKMLNKAIYDVQVSADKAPPKVEWRNPLEAMDMREDANVDECYMTNVRWAPRPSATVADCLEEAALTIGNACKLILSNAYEESEDTMSLLLGMAKVSVDTAHSKLIQFAGESLRQQEASS